jgi:plastocyanin
MHFSLASVVLATLASTVSAANIQVQVGASSALTFTPPSVNASTGDTVTFVFNPKNHTVTQSTFAAPCQPMSGGADSGFQAVTANATNVPSFSVTVNNTQPAWFFCKQTGYGVTLPIPHIIYKLTICDIVTVSRAWSLLSTQQRTRPLKHTRLPPRRHLLMAHLPIQPTQLARALALVPVPVPVRAQDRQAPPHLPRHQNPMAPSLLVHVRVASSLLSALPLAFYSRLFYFSFSPGVWWFAIPSSFAYCKSCFNDGVVEIFLKRGFLISIILIAGLCSDDMNTKDLAVLKGYERRCKASRYEN